MSLDYDHNCEYHNCINTPEQCFCQRHLDEFEQEAYDRGYADAKKDLEKENERAS